MAGFGGVVDYVIVPLAYLLLAIAPNCSLKADCPSGGVGTEADNPSALRAVLQMKAHGAGHSLVMTVFHEDLYILTAAPVRHLPVAISGWQPATPVCGAGYAGGAGTVFLRISPAMVCR